LLLLAFEEHNGILISYKNKVVFANGLAKNTKIIHDNKWEDWDIIVFQV